MPTRKVILERATEIYMKEQGRYDGALGSTTPELNETFFSMGEQKVRDVT